jgi:hypothetical protein
LLCEVPIEGEGGPDALPSHELKADEVNQAQVPLTGHQKANSRWLMDIGAYPMHMDRADKLKQQVTSGANAKAALGRRHAFQHDVVACAKVGFISQ